MNRPSTVLAGAAPRRQPGSRWGRRFLAALAAAALLVGSLPTAAWAGDKDGRAVDRDERKVDEYVRQEAARQPHGTIPVLIEQMGAAAALGAVRAHGGKVERELQTKHTLVAEIPAEKLAALAKDPAVGRISFDAPMRSLDKPDQDTPASQEREAQQPNQRKTAQLGDNLRTVYPLAVRAEELWAGQTGKSPVTGSGVTVAVLDSGISDDHPDFRGVNATKENEPGDSRVVAKLTKSSGLTSEDDYGHGTFVAGIIGGRGWGSKSKSDDGAYVGVAPDVNLVSVKISDKKGVSRVSQTIDAIEWVVTNKDRYHIRVINLSSVSTIAESYKTSLLDAAVEMAWMKGIVVVVSAGNGEPNTMLYAPANDPYVITVGATDDMGTAPTADDRLVWFSSYGTTQDGIVKPELVAPGRRIVSTLSSDSDPLGRLYPDRIVDRLYIRLSGTSAAAPVVTGVVAQLLQARPDLTPDQVKWLLTRTARPVPGPGTGAGYPQAAAAVRYTGAVGRANHGLVPNNYVALAGYSLLTGAKNVDWDNVAWNQVPWERVPWGRLSWDSSTWSSSTWSSSTWSSSTWSSSTWSSSTWSSSTWSNVAGD